MWFLTEAGDRISCETFRVRCQTPPTSLPHSSPDRSAQGGLDELNPSSCRARGRTRAYGASHPELGRAAKPDSQRCERQYSGGSHALRNISGGFNNPASGLDALIGTTDGERNTAVGAYALGFNNGTLNTA